MQLLNDILIFLHVIGLFLGTAPGLGNAVVSRQLINATPEAAAALRQLPPIFANISTMGLAILWISGVVLIFTRWGGVEHLTVLFWIRAAFIVVLTIVAIMIHMTIREARNTGDVAITERLRPFVVIGMIAALAAIFVTVLTFQHT